MADNWETISAELTSNVNSIENNIINYSLNTKGNINDYFIIDYLSANNQTSTFNLFNDFVNKTQLLFYKPYSLNWFKQVTQVYANYWVAGLSGLTYYTDDNYTSFNRKEPILITSDISSSATADAYKRYYLLSSMLSARSNYNIDYDNCSSYQYMISTFINNSAYLIEGSSIPDTFISSDPTTYISSFATKINGGTYTTTAPSSFDNSYLVKAIKLDKESYVSILNWGSNVSEGAFVELVKLPYISYDNINIDNQKLDIDTQKTQQSSFLTYTPTNITNLSGALGCGNCIPKTTRVDSDATLYFYKEIFPKDTEISICIGWMTPNNSHTQSIRTFVNIYPILTDAKSIQDNLSVFNQ